MAGASSGWVGRVLEVDGLQTDRDQLVIGRFRFGVGRGGGERSSRAISEPIRGGDRHVRTTSVRAPLQASLPGALLATALSS